MDDRLYQVEQQKQQALNQSNSMYEGLLNDNQNLYNQNIENVNQQEQIQNEILDKQLANQRTEIEKQKEIANQNYQTEAKRAKNDYTSFINPYGVNAESQANQGLANSGLSETTKLGGWNTYQNRLASANKVMQDAFTQYDRDLNDAMLNNDVQKAQNALNKLQMQIQFSQNFYNNKSSLTQNQLSNNQSLDNDYFNRYQTIYGNIEAEKARAEAIRQWEAEMAEKQRQYNENMAWQKEQQRIQQEQWAKQYALSQYQAQTARQKAAQSQNQNTPSLDDTSDKRNIDNSQVTANMTPYFNTSAGKEWFDNNFSNSMSKNELVSTVARGISLGQISDVEADRIYDCYGLK